MRGNTVCRVLAMLALAAVFGLGGAGAGRAAEVADKGQVLHSASRELDVTVRYPAFGLAAVDADIRHWAEGLAANFKSEYGAEARADTRLPYQLDASYEVVRVPGGLLSVIWRVRTYTGGAHGGMDLVSFNYMGKSGRPLALLDVFERPERALRLLAEQTRARLGQSLGDMLVQSMLEAGTAPEADNFSTFALLPGAIRIYFPPYQVAPWAAGAQSVEVPLEALKDAGPRLRLWGK